MFGSIGGAVAKVLSGGSTGDITKGLSTFGGGSVLGGALNVGMDAAFGTNLSGTQAQMDMAKEANRITQSESARNRAFQQMMSNTAYQRSMADMKKAGLNPMLAFQQGGASTPSGSSGSGQGAGNLNPVSGAKLKNLDVKLMQKNIDNASSTGKQIKAATEKIETETRALKAQEETSKQDAKFLKENEWYRKAERYLRLFGMGSGAVGAAAGYGTAKALSRKKKVSKPKTKFEQSRQKTKQMRDNWIKFNNSPM
jgi:hypothetical protein